MRLQRAEDVLKGDWTAAGHKVGQMAKRGEGGRGGGDRR